MGSNPTGSPEDMVTSLPRLVRHYRVTVEDEEGFALKTLDFKVLAGNEREALDYMGEVMAIWEYYNGE